MSRTKLMGSALLAVLLSGAAAGCGAGSPPVPETPPASPTPASSTPASRTPASPTPASSTPAASTPAPPIPLTQFCTTESVPAGVTQGAVAVGSQSSIATATLGSGKTTAILLHQTSGNGLCGFLPYAGYLAQRGVRVVLIDLCGYGQSLCNDLDLYNDPAGQVRAVSETARADGATRVVLVGASMGGTVAVHAAQATRADAVVDLSGPAEFNGMSIAAAAPEITMAALFAYGRTDQSDLTAVRGTFESVPSDAKTFLTFDRGHGYELLRSQDDPDRWSPLAGRVLDVVRGASAGDSG